MSKLTDPFREELLLNIAGHCSAIEGNRPERGADLPGWMSDVRVSQELASIITCKDISEDTLVLIEWITRMMLDHKLGEILQENS